MAPTRRLTLEEEANHLAEGMVTSVALTEQALERIEESQGTLNAFKIVRRERALEEAALADARLAAGRRSLLLGVPVAVKDDTDVAGHPTAHGCGGDFPSKTVDSWMVARLRAAGAIIIGKTNTPQLGQWPFTEGPAFGVTRNPWSLQHSPGGSSGGAAAAVAAGLVAGAVGSDGAGSIRIPASWTNLVGIKPQRGRISSWPEPEAFCGLSVNGPLTRTVTDAALLLDATAGRHVGDVDTPPPPLGSFRAAADREPGRLRIGLSTGIPFGGPRAPLDPQLWAGLLRLANTLAELGHDVLSHEPRYGLSALSFIPRTYVGIGDVAARVADTRALDPRTQENCRRAKLMAGPLLWAARRCEQPLRERVGAAFDTVDVILSPTTAQGPFPIGTTDGLSNWQTFRVIAAACPFTWAWNVLGWPSVNVPAGFTTTGLPFGAQLLGHANSETRLISLAAQLESVERWHENTPHTPTRVTAQPQPRAGSM